MSYLYLILDIGAVFFPIVLSFDKKVAFYKSFLAVLLSIVIIGIPFIVWDIYFTNVGVWGFNENYLLDLTIINLPLEEILFFVVVPYACTFIYACCKVYFSKFNFTKFNILFLIFFGAFSLCVLTAGFGKWYSNVASLTAIFTMVVFLIAKSKLNYLPVAFMISLIPFFVMNGILTGGLTAEPIVWYNNLENVEIRIWTIPIEDILYGFTLIALNIMVYEGLINFKKKH